MSNEVEIFLLVMSSVVDTSVYRYLHSPCSVDMTMLCSDDMTLLCSVGLAELCSVDLTSLAHSSGRTAARLSYPDRWNESLAIVLANDGAFRLFPARWFLVTFRHEMANTRLNSVVALINGNKKRESVPVLVVRQWFGNKNSKSAPISATPRS